MRIDVVDKGTFELTEGSTFYDLAQLCQDQYPDDIILAMQGNRLRELNKVIKNDTPVQFLTTMHPDGRRAYRRSVTFLMQRALDELFADKHADIHVHYSIGQGYYCEAFAGQERVTPTEELIRSLKAEMEQLVRMDVPIVKASVSTRAAIETFHEQEMTSKEHLLRYRSSSHINLYDLYGMKDYFYGYMAPSTGMLRYFDLCLYEQGFMLLFPNENSRVVAEFKPLAKLFQVQKSSADWSEMMGIGTVGELNDAIADGKARDIILMQEALMEQKVGALAEKIASDKSKKFVMIAGPSSSGKTSFSYRLSLQLRGQGIHPYPLSLDDYYLDRDKCPIDPETGKVDLESITCLDVEQFNHDMLALLNGDRVEIPSFNFKTGKREYRGNFIQLGEGDVMVIEGIHGLNDQLSYMIPAENKYKIYISALTQLSIDDHNPLATTDGRLIRRIVRDARTRGTSAAKTIEMWPSVRAGEEKNIFPFQEDADTMFNSALIYEMAVLKLYAVPQLYAIHEDSPQYPEAKRLLKLLDYFLPIPPEDINNTSLVREFIGGSLFNV